MSEKSPYISILEKRKKYIPNVLLISLLTMLNAVEASADTEKSPNPIAVQAVTLQGSHVEHTHVNFWDTSVTGELDEDPDSPDNRKHVIYQTGLYTTTVASDAGLDAVSQGVFDKNPSFSEYAVMRERVSFTNEGNALTNVTIGQDIIQEVEHWTTKDGYPQSHTTSVFKVGNATTIKVDNISPIENFGYKIKNTARQGETNFVKGPYYDTPTIEYTASNLENLEISTYIENVRGNFEMRIKFDNTIPEAFKNKRTKVTITPTLRYEHAIGTITDLESGLTASFSCIDRYGDGVMQGDDTVFNDFLPRFRLFVPLIAGGQ